MKISSRLSIRFQELQAAGMQPYPILGVLRAFGRSSQKSFSCVPPWENTGFTLESRRLSWRIPYFSRRRAISCEIRCA